MNVTINIPEDLYMQAKLLADANKIPVEQVFVSAFLDQQNTLQRLQRRSSDASREKFLAVLDAVPDIPAEDFDRI